MQFPEQKICEIDYIPARITEGKEWYVSFYCFNPAKGRLDRKKIMLNRVKNVNQRRDVARKLVIKLNAKLKTGWNPFIEEEASKAYHKLFEVLDTYIKIQEKDNAEENTLRSYRSFIKYLKNYIEKEIKQPDMYVYGFTDSVASDLMLHINLNENKSARTYNNYLTFYKTLFNWMVEARYKKTNPFTPIKKKNTKKAGKNRKPIPPELIKKIYDYLYTENRNYLALMLIEYYCLMRPKEISHLKIGDINFLKGTITVNEKEAKNDNTSHRTIPPILLELLQKLNFPNNKDYYLFSDDGHYNFVPGRKHMDSRKIAKYWAKLRDKFKFGLEYKFYSLKDTGIIDYLESGVSIEDVRAQADHHDISVTGIYARHTNQNGSDQIRKNAKHI